MPRKKTTGRVAKTRGISFDPQLDKLTLLRAEELKMSVSEYVRRCIQLEISRGGAMVIHPSSDEDKLPPDESPRRRRF